MNFKLAILVTLIGVGLTVRGDCADTCDSVYNEGRIEIVDVKNMTHKQFVKELIQISSSKSLGDAREKLNHTLNSVSVEDRKEIRSALQEELLLWVAQHGSADSLRAQQNVKKPNREAAVLSAYIPCWGTIGGLTGLFYNVFNPEDQIDLDDVFGAYKFFNLTTPNQKIAAVTLTSLAATIVGLVYCDTVHSQYKIWEAENKKLYKKRDELYNIEALLDCCHT